MLGTIFWIALGAFLGWNLPQPEWAKRLQGKVQNTLTFRSPK